MSVLGTYHPADSPLHRIPAGVKILLLIVASVALFLVSSLWVMAVAVACGALLYALARIPVRVAWSQLRPVAFIVGFVFVGQWILLGLPTAALISVRIVLLVALAGLMTVTTRTMDLVSAIERGLAPIRRFGADPTRIGLMVALVLRSVAVLSEVAGEIRQAQRARGVERSIVGFAVPFVVRTLKRADALGEALAARGVDDD